MKYSSTLPIQLLPIQLDGSVTTNIPLPELAAEIGKQMSELYKRVGFQVPWVGYLVFQENLCVGTCAFKSPPQENQVEIAYFTFPEYEGLGVATRMAAALINLAQKTQSSVKVTAQTLPEKNPSTRILEKLKFSCMGPVQHPEDGEVWQWELGS